ncbi:hypothetical protein Bbelb_211280 [Branchiostoma belcheri]|nr:hypothetical protein Bbelb_211280 [Branchiostoma belcheri]
MAVVVSLKSPQLATQFERTGPDRGTVICKRQLVAGECTATIGRHHDQQLTVTRCYLAPPSEGNQTWYRLFNQVFGHAVVPRAARGEIAGFLTKWSLDEEGKWRCCQEPDGVVLERLVFIRFGKLIWDLTMFLCVLRDLTASLNLSIFLEDLCSGLYSRRILTCHLSTREHQT